MYRLKERCHWYSESATDLTTEELYILLTVHLGTILVNNQLDGPVPVAARSLA